MTPSRAWFVGVLVVLVGVGAPSAQPAVPTLPVWPGHVAGGAVQVDALDVDGELLRSALAPTGASYVTTPAAKTITGRVQVARRADAMAALVAREPSLAVTSRPMRGRGPTVDLDFSAAPTRDLYRLLAEVLRTNIVVLMPSTDLTIRVKRKPAGGVLAEVARASGAVIDRPARNVIVVRAASAPPTARLPTGGAKLRLAARAVAGGQLVELIRALDGPRSPADLMRDASLMCAAGQPVDLVLNQVATDAARLIVAWASGVNLRGPGCGLSPLPHDPTADLKLLATVARGRTRLAAVEVAGRAYLVTHGGAWEVGDGRIVHHGPQTVREWRLYASAIDLSGAGLAGDAPGGIRLAATIVDGGANVAIVEVGGGFRIWREGRPNLGDFGERLDVTITPGQVQVHGGDLLRLAPRAP